MTHRTPISFISHPKALNMIYDRPRSEARMSEEKCNIKHKLSILSPEHYVSFGLLNSVSFISCSLIVTRLVIYVKDNKNLCYRRIGVGCLKSPSTHGSISHCCCFELERQPIHAQQRLSTKARGNTKKY